MEINRRYDLIINCIGKYKPTTDIFDQDEFRSSTDFNFAVLQYLLKVLRPFIGHNAKLINISSIASHSGGQKEFSYSASKELVDRLMGELRFDSIYRHVRLLNVRSGAVVSKMTSERPSPTDLIKPDELSELCLQVINAGESLIVPTLDVYRAVR